MKPYCSLLSAAVAMLLAAPPALSAQTGAGDPVAPPAASAAAGKAPVSLRDGRKLVKVPPMAASARTPAKLRASTAQSAAARGNAVPLATLPALEIKQLDGTQIALSAVPHPAHWFLLYRPVHCLPCDRTMNNLAATSTVEADQGHSLVVLVEGKEAAQMLTEMRGHFSKLNEAKWASVKAGTAKKAFAVKGAPVLYALDGQKVKWVQPGAMRSKVELEARVTAWLKSEPTPAPATLVAPSATLAPAQPASATK